MATGAVTSPGGSLRDEVKTAVLWRSGSQIAAQLVDFQLYDLHHRALNANSDASVVAWLTPVGMALAVAGILTGALTRRRGPLVAVLPYLVRRLRWRGTWRRPVARRNAALLAGDAVGFAALVRGSIAARRLLL